MRCTTGCASPTMPSSLQPGSPTDTSAGIRTSGLLGDQFIALEPGGEEELLTSGEEIDYTESALSIERLIGKFVHDSGVQGD